MVEAVRKVFLRKFFAPMRALAPFHETLMRQQLFLQFNHFYG
jgi:hypothetical protein